MLVHWERFPQRDSSADRLSPVTSQLVRLNDKLRAFLKTEFVWIFHENLLFFLPYKLI